MAHIRFRNRAPLRVVAALTFGGCLAALSGCSGDGGSEPAPASDEPSGTDSSDDERLPDPSNEDGAGATELSLSTEGDIALSSGVAQLTFLENSDRATLNIVATSANNDSMYMTLSYPRDADVFGPHVTALGLPKPGQGENVAHVLLGSAPADYHYSRSGQVVLTLSREGHQISGTFDIAVSEVNDLGQGEFEPVGDTTPLTGSFTGSYEVLCYSVLPGHTMAVRSDIQGGFCESLGL
jgi:hypothetical protein